MSMKLLCLYLVQNLLHQIKAQQFYTDLDLSIVLSSTENRRIQGLFKAFGDFPVLIKADLIFKDFSKQEGQVALNRSPEFCLKLT